VSWIANIVMWRRLVVVPSKINTALLLMGSSPDRNVCCSLKGIG
jgi:hypothetical protein